MDDLEEEFLALAGEASSDEDEGPVNDRKASQSPGSQRGNSRRNRHNDSEEEGEASSRHSSPDSLRSAPMDESDSDSDASPGTMYEEGDKYPLEGRFMNAADKAEIMALPEIKREELLAERALEVDRYNQNRALRQLLNAREAENRKQDKKRKAGAADLEDSQRKTSRQRTKVGGGKVGESSSGIDNLKRARAEKDDRRRRREDNQRNRHSTRDDYSDDAGGDSEVEWDDGKPKYRSPSYDDRSSEPATMTDFERVRVGRSRFALVCFYPGFEEAIAGCYVRVCVGKDPESHQNIYRMAVIKGFTEGRPYAMESANGKKFTTNQYARVAHGKAEKEWSFIMCSDAPFTEREYNRYETVCKGEGVTLPPKIKLVDKITDINNLVNRSWTEDELQAKLKRSGALTTKFLPIERNRLTNLIKEAKARGDDEAVSQLTEEFEALDGPKLAHGTSLATPRKAPGKLSEQERLAALNRENRRKNVQEIRQAQINERRAARQTEAAIARGEVVVEDHSRRVKTKAKFKYDVTENTKKDGDSGASTPTASTPTLAAKTSSPLPHLAKLQKATDNKGLPTIHRPLMDDDIIGAIDLGIELEL